MTALSSLWTGGRLTGAAARGIAPSSAYKTQNQSVASTTQTADSDLLLTLVANAVYYFNCTLAYQGAASGDGDIQFTWSLPSGASMAYALIGWKGGDPTAGYWETESSTVSLNTNGAGVNLSLVMQGTVTTANTPGSMVFEWEQNTANSTTATVVVGGSSLLAWRIQ